MRKKNKSKNKKILTDEFLDEFREHHRLYDIKIRYIKTDLGNGQKNFKIEKQINRYLNKNEHVHHINLIKNDNSLDNLVLFNNASEHFLAHGSLNKCVAKLIEKNLLTFNRITKTYEVV